MNKDKADFEKLINGICVTFSQIQMSNHQDDYKEHEDCIEELWEFIQKREKEAKIEVLEWLQENASGGGDWRSKIIMKINNLKDE